jgi:hypothetical protein
MRSLAEKQEKKEHEGHEGHEEDDVWSRDGVLRGLRAFVVKSQRSLTMSVALEEGQHDGSP